MKTVFITGGSSGIGAACVARFLAAQWQVSFLDTDTIGGQSLVKTFSHYPNLLFVEGDICSKQSLSKAIDETCQRFGALNAVVANAGIHRVNSLLDISNEDLNELINVNVKGTINTLQATVPHLISGGGGSIVISASNQCFVGKANSFGYGLTKGALGQMTRSLAIELGPKYIRVNAVCPGTIRTPLLDRLFQHRSEVEGESLESIWRRENTLHHVGHIGEACEVAEAIYFLASDAASFCTGGLYPVDGGVTAR